MEGNLEGQAWLRNYLDENALAHQSRDAFTYVLGSAGHESLETEAVASREAHLEIRLLEEPDIALPYPIAGALTLSDQTRFDPVSVLAALCADLRRRGATLFDDTRLTGSGHSAPLQLTTTRGTLGADTLILATGTPVLDRGGYFAKLEPSRSYLAAYTGSPDVQPFPERMYLSIDSPGRSLRTATRDGKPVLLVGGNGHPVGDGAPPEAARDLDRWARENFALAERTHGWSAQDHRSFDAVPFVGRMPRGGRRIHVATGYNKWA
jgi:glycine/D-amino acid oxidase-like deaminating enzyme